MGLSAGTKLGPYEIVAPLGAGGMGEVYRARDTRLGREVAIKVLPEEFFEDRERKGRFEREAKLLAAVSHPNIAVIHSFEEISGRYLLVQELLEGEPLREKLGAPLPPKKAVDYAVQIAHGLAAAHEKGIVHRDLKPENLFVTKDGHVKILDFGVAKLLPSFDSGGVDTQTPTESATQPGTAVGTVAYMSPEQIRGQPVDARTDIFSSGVVLYEMLAGKRPFQGETPAETMTAILREEPPDLSETNRSVPHALEEVVRHCLEKEPEGRFHSARDVIFALEALPEVSTAKPGAPMSPVGVWLHRHRRALAGAAIALVLVAAGVLIVSRRYSAASRRLPSVLALPCKVYGAPEVEYLTDAVPGTISTLLSQVEGIDTKVPPSSFEVEKVKGDLTKLAELYQVSSFIVTSITPSPGRFALNVQLVDAATRKVKWGKQYEGAREAYNDLARQAADGIRLAVRPSTSPVPTSGLSSEAELAFREGMYNFNRYHGISSNRQVFEAAVTAFTRALTLDPSFATAAGRVAQLFAVRYEIEGDVHDTLRQAESWARRALGIDPRCGDAWAALSAVEQYATHADPERGVDYAVKAVAFAPRDAWAHVNLGLWVNSPGSNALMVAASLRASELDPFLLSGAGNAVVGLCWLGRPGEALVVIDRALKMEPEFPLGLSLRGFVLTRLGRLEEAERTLRDCQPALTAMRTQNAIWNHMRFALAVAQRDNAMSEALAPQILASVFDSRADTAFVGIVALITAPAMVRVGRVDDAIRILEKSIEVGAPPAYDWTFADPDIKLLRGDPRFAKVLAASRDGAAMVARVLGEARRRGELPRYLEAPLDDLLKLLKENGSKS
jgi:tRNA A-37 threonylcarbamoyl transferase component Bud32/tetratricopeptide (TPR) repeat protein